MPVQKQTLFAQITEFADEIGLTNHPKLLIAFSGGADSRLLLEWALETWPTGSVSAMYFDHGLRDTSADKALIAEIHSRIPIKIVSIDVTGDAQHNKISLEMAGRKLRYQHLLEAAKLLQVSAITTAHHFDDKVETALLRFVAGSFNGMGSIQASVTLSKDIVVFRPLLKLTKAELIRELKTREISWSEDPTNQSDDFARNQVRNQVIPQIKKINPSFEKAVGRFCDTIDELNIFLNNQLKLVEADSKEGMCIHLTPFLIFDPFVAKSVLKLFCDQTESEPRLISKHHIHAIYKVATGKIRQTELPGHRIAKIKNNCLVIINK